MLGRIQNVRARTATAIPCNRHKGKAAPATPAPVRPAVSVYARSAAADDNAIVRIGAVTKPAGRGISWPSRRPAGVAQQSHDQLKTTASHQSLARPDSPTKSPSNFSAMDTAGRVCADSALSAVMSSTAKSVGPTALCGDEMATNNPLENIRKGELKRILRHRGTSEVEVANALADILAEHSRWTTVALGERMKLTFNETITLAIRNAKRAHVDDERAALSIARHRDQLDADLAGPEHSIGTLPAVTAADPAAAGIADIVYSITGRIVAEQVLRRLRLALLLALPLAGGLVLAVGAAVAARRKGTE